MNLKNFGDLFDGTLSVPPPQPTPNTRPTPYPTPVPTPNPRELSLFEGEYGYLFDIFDIENYGMYENFDYFGGLLDGTLLVPIHDTTPSPRPTPNPREFCFLGGENNDLLNIFGNENFFENELNVHFQDFETG